MMNVWVGDFAYPGAAEPVTREMTNAVQDYAWAYTNDHILYTQDTDGDENFNGGWLRDQLRALVEPNGVTVPELQPGETAS